MSGQLDGFYDVPALGFEAMGAGAFTPFGAILPPSGAVFYVRGNGTAITEYAWDPPGLRERLNASVVTALRQCVANRGDRIIVLEGHTENLAAADSWSGLVAGVKIIGVGDKNSTNRPTFTFTTATSTVLLDVANVTIANCRFLCAGPAGTTALSVAAPFTLSAAGCKLLGNYMQISIDADQLATIAITTTAAADDCEISGNEIIGATAGEVTTAIQIVGADRLKMRGNYIAGATSAVGVGIVRFATTASLDIVSEGNTFINRKALSTCAVTGLAAVSGVSRGDHFAYLDTSSMTPWLTSTGIMTFHRPTLTNTAGETGTEVVGTVSAAV